MEENIIHNENELLLRIAAGDEKSFRILFDLYRDHVYTKAYYFLKNFAQAEDILQEVFLKIWKNRTELSEIQNFKGFLNVVTRNMIFSYLRKTASQTLLIEKLRMESGTEVVPHVIKHLDNKELYDSLQRAMSLLTRKQKQVFELSRIEGLSHAEIAEHLNMNRETVKKHVTDALRTIRSSMNTFPSIQIAMLLFFIPT